MADIIITAEHMYHYQIDSEMLAGLERDIKQLDPSFEVDSGFIVQKDFDPDLVTGVVSIMLADAAKHIASEIMALVIAGIRRALTKDNRPEPPPIRIHLYGPDDRPISSVLVRDPIGEPEDITEPTQQQPPRR